MIEKIKKVTYYDKSEGRIQISLRGKWLNYCGFSKDDKVLIISPKDELLIIKKISEEKSKK